MQMTIFVVLVSVLDTFFVWVWHNILTDTINDVGSCIDREADWFYKVWLSLDTLLDPLQGSRI